MKFIFCNMETVFDTMSQNLNKILPEIIDLERFQTKFSYQPLFSGI